MKHKEEVLALLDEGKKVWEIAKALKVTKNTVYNVLYRSGTKLDKGTKCKEAAIYSMTHGASSASKKFGIKREAIYHYRRVYKEAIQEALKNQKEKES